MKQEFNERDHPRDEYGRFIEKTTKELKESQQIEIPDKQKKIKEDITPQVFERIRTVREKLEQKGKARVIVYTFNYKYWVEIHNDDEYSYTILKRRKIK